MISQSNNLNKLNPIKPFYLENKDNIVSLSYFKALYQEILLWDSML